MQDIQLKENIIHGTTARPVNAIRFYADQGPDHNAPLIVPNHWHNYAEINLIRKGSYEFHINLTPMILKEGDVCILNSGDLHQLRMLDADCCHDTFLFDPDILHFHYQDQWSQEVITPWISNTLRCANVIHPNDAGYQDILLLLGELFERTYYKKPFWYEKSKIKLLEGLLCLQEYGYLMSGEELQKSAKVSQIERYKRIVYYIENNYQEQITLEELAALIPCNSQYLCRFFKKISGETPIQYLIHYRVDQAARMLRETGKNVSEIAMDCGFDNISYFIRKFKEIHGVTPGEFKR